MSQCIFCKIVAGEIPSYKVYEDEKYLGFLDLAQVNDGHLLLIPKKHCRWVWDIENIGDFFETAKKIVRQMQKVTKDEFVMSLMWGRDVHHAHLHLVPSTSGNLELVAEGWRAALQARKLGAEEMRAIAEKFKLSK
jgi:histidine triad (HIT) family protein